MLLFLGLGLLDEWIVKGRRRLPWIEYAILLLIAATIVSLGFLEGVGVGMLITMVFFAVRLSRVDLIEASYTARERHSNRSRSIPDRAILRAEGERIQAYRLRGYIFFGSVGPLLDRLRQSLDSHPEAGLHPAGFRRRVRIRLLGHQRAVQVHARRADRRSAGGAERSVGETRERTGRATSPPPFTKTLLFEPDADRALERCEDIVLATWRSDPAADGDLGDTLLERVVGDMERHLDRQVVFEDIVDELRDWLEPREFDAGEALVSIGEPQKGLQLLIKGQASAFDSTGARLFQCGPGDAVEPRGAFGCACSRDRHDCRPALPNDDADPCRPAVAGRE